MSKGQYDLVADKKKEFNKLTSLKVPNSVFCLSGNVMGLPQHNFLLYV